MLGISVAEVAILLAIIATMAFALYFIVKMAVHHGGK
jgi:hypothetical protein